MVSIGKVNWLQLGATKVGQTQSPSSGVHFGGGNSAQGGNTLQDRLEAIDKGNPTAFTSLSGPSKVAGISGISSSGGGSLLERLDAIGTGELSPQYGSKEKNLDWIM